MAVEIKYKKLFIPGPVEVKKPILEEMGHWMIGHRSQEFMELYADTIPKLKKLLFTKQNVFLSTSSSSGIWELGARNLVDKKVLCCVMGAFSDKWSKTCELCGKEVVRIEVPMGKAIKAEDIRAKLEEGGFDALTIVHNETSTGVMLDLESVAEVMKDFPDVMFMVDAVSSMSAVPIEFDKLGIDLIFAGVQKAFALPPGLTVFAVSDRAMEKAKTIKNRGYYFNLDIFAKYHSKNQTPTTPAIAHLFALNKQLDNFFEEGLENRFKRHADMADYVRGWCEGKGFSLFSEEGFRSQSVTAINNDLGINIVTLNKELAKSEMMISNGYGDLKEKTFRIAHMGDIQMEDLKALTAKMDEIIDSGVCK